VRRGCRSGVGREKKKNAADGGGGDSNQGGKVSYRTTIHGRKKGGKSPGTGTKEKVVREGGGKKQKKITEKMKKGKTWPWWGPGDFARAKTGRGKKTHPWEGEIYGKKKAINRNSGVGVEKTGLVTGFKENRTQLKMSPWV